jgi:hypothetical protein
LVHEREEEVGADAGVYQDDRIAGTPDLVLQLDVAD